MSGRKANKKIRFRVFQTEVSIWKKAYADGGFGIFFPSNGTTSHLSVHLDRPERIRVHLIENGKIVDIIFDTNNKTEELKNKLKEMENILLRDPVDKIQLYEVKQSVLSEIKRINEVNKKIDEPQSDEVQAMNVDENYTKTIVDLVNCTNYENPIKWEDREKHALLGGENNILYFSHQSKIYPITEEKLTGLMKILMKFSITEKVEETIAKLTEKNSNSLRTNSP